MKISRVEFAVSPAPQKGVFICPEALNPEAYLRQILSAEQNKNLTVLRVLVEELPPHPDAMGQDILLDLSQKNHWLRVVTIQAGD
jgi:hypothetical protein